MNISINGPGVYFTIPILGGIRITQTAVALLAVTLLLILLAFLVTRKIEKRPSGLQVIVEKLVSMLYNLVESTMGKHNLHFAPYIGALFLSSLFGSLIGLTKIFTSTTGDLSVTMAWALVTTAMVWYSNIKNFGFKAWLKGFTEPIAVMTPMNIVSEIANPISMAFRHFGNVAGGSVLMSVIYAALAAFSSVIFGWIPGIIGQIPFFQVGLPAILSIYFDLFSGFVQAFVFCLLTMIYVGAANPPAEELPVKKKKAKRKKNS